MPCAAAKTVIAAGGTVAGVSRADIIGGDSPILDALERHGLDGLSMIIALAGQAVGVFDIGTQERVWMAFGGGAFGGYGSALTLAAWSYQRRTRPRCPEASTGASGHPEPVPVPCGVPGGGGGLSRSDGRSGRTRR